MSQPGVAFTKGHGTGNDFVILSDLDRTLDVSAPLVRALCQRRTGVGADGVLVVARTAAHPEVQNQAGTAEIFMDYRNADGSAAQMCGNGARVFAAFLVRTGLATEPQFHIATRGGPRSVRVSSDESVAVGMGLAAFLDRDDIRVRPADAVDPQPLSAVGVHLPNPHAVVWADDLAAAGALLQAPIVTPAEAYPEGVNVEFVQRLSDDHIAMRVFERGVGETLSCGTGACAAAVAARRSAGASPDGQRVRVDVPGGSLGVTWQRDGTVDLDGPASFVAHGTIDPHWWEAHV